MELNRVHVAVRASSALAALGLSNFLECRTDIAVLPRVRAAEADVLVLGADSLDVALAAKLRALTTKSSFSTVLVTSRLSESDLPAAAECRVVEVLPRTTTSDQLVEAVLAAAAPPRTSADIVEALRVQLGRLSAGTTPDIGLQAREIDVLRLVAEGMETSEIAQRLCYSERTVKNVLDLLRRRLSLNNRPQTVAYALRAGLI
jgi:DNA-binding NarL/FixJ family response regulator